LIVPIYYLKEIKVLVKKGVMMKNWSVKAVKLTEHFNDMT